MRADLKIAFLTALLFAAPISVQAAAKPPAALDVARKALAGAIAAHDLKAAFAHTGFPLAVDMYQAPPELTRTQALANPRKFTVLFGDGDKDLLACVATAPLTFQGDKTQFGAGSWLADCNGNEFYFAQRGGQWLFTAYQNINE